MTEAVLTGRLLVASPVLQDGTFDRTVVLMLDHSPGGALGVVLNRPTDTRVEDALPGWAPLVGAPAVVFVGGPVSPGAAIGLARADAAAAEGWQPVGGGLGTIDLGLDPDEVPVRPEALRIFAGYAGWAAGQLESELSAGAWFVVDAEPADSHSPDPAPLWRRVLRRQSGALAAVANMPADLSVN